MSKLQYLSVDNLAGSSVPFAYAAKAGPWIFLNGHEAYDFSSGDTPEVDGPDGFPSFGEPRLKREAEYILTRMKQCLKEFGSDFSHSLRVDQYYPIFEAVRAYHLARHGAFGNYIPPSTSVLMKRLFNPKCSISMSMIATVPHKDYEIKRLFPKDVPVPVGSYFVPAVTCNDFVFVAGQMASDDDALEPSVRMNPLRNWGGPNAIRKQTEFVIKKRLEPALIAGDSSWENIIKAQIYVPTAEDIPDALDVWHTLVGNHPCAITALPTHGFGFVDGLVEINLIALRHGSSRKKEVLKISNPKMSSYGQCIRAGELVFPSGIMPIDLNGNVVGIKNHTNLDSMNYSSQVQAMAVLDFAEEICKAAGTNLSNVARAQYFMSDVTEFSGVQLAWMSRLGKQPHPFVSVQVPGSLSAPGASLTADFWIYAP